LFSRNISASDPETDDDDLIDIIDVVETVTLKFEDMSTDDSGLDVHELIRIFKMVSLLIIRAIVTQLTLQLEP
jgi:hypothetical protein